MNVGILGCATVARKYVVKAFKAMTEVDKVFIASRDEKKARSVAKELGIEFKKSYEEIINSNKIDVVYVPLPIGLHKEWVLKAAKKGKHIICEKSISDSYKSAKDMVEGCKAKKLTLFENFMCDYHPQHSKVLSMIHDGHIGKVITIKAYFGFPPLDKKGFRYDKDLGGGSLNDAGAYTTFISRKMLETEPIAVTCIFEMDPGAGVDIRGSALLEFPSNMTALVSFGFDNVYQNNYSIWGSQGLITVKRAFSIPPDLKPQIQLYKNKNFQEKYTEIDVLPANQFELILKDFFQTVLNDDGKKREEKYEQILNQARLLEVMRISANEKRKVRLNEI
ncbi:Gfo/Idh/MocA family oxidoreductase [archaeon AH-315-M20]|nr:Gfo/Idh/MocA family oxidoreductase [archaeon AH-315-M20]